MTDPGSLTDDPEVDRRLRLYAERVRTSPHNLVSRRARQELLDRHIPECVAFAATLPRGPIRVLDLGSGGGFPGIPVALCRPDLDVHLLDATAKKTEFLRETAEQLDLVVSVHTGRAEDLAADRRLGGSFDVVTARAVAPLGRLIEWALPFLTTGGLLYAMKGDRWQEELEEAAPVLERTGASVVATPEDVHGADVGDGATRPRVVIVARGPR